VSENPSTRVWLALIRKAAETLMGRRKRRLTHHLLLFDHALPDRQITPDRDCQRREWRYAFAFHLRIRKRGVLRPARGCAVLPLARRLQLGMQSRALEDQLGVFEPG